MAVLLCHTGGWIDASMHGQMDRPPRGLPKGQQVEPGCLISEPHLWPNRTTLVFVCWLLCFGQSHCMMKFPGPGSNPNHSSDNNAESLITGLPVNSGNFFFFQFIYRYFPQHNFFPTVQHGDPVIDGIKH